jgi:nitrate reductase alpha subunit
LGELLGLTKEQLIAATRKTAHTTYLAVGLATVICQGGLAFYYHRKKPAIYRALSKT